MDQDVGAELLDNGLVVNVPEPGTLRLLPPLTVEPDHVDRAVAAIGSALISYATTR